MLFLVIIFGALLAARLPPETAAILAVVLRVAAWAAWRGVRGTMRGGVRIQDKEPLQFSFSEYRHLEIEQARARTRGCFLQLAASALLVTGSVSLFTLGAPAYEIQKTAEMLSMVLAIVFVVFASASALYLGWKRMRGGADPNDNFELTRSYGDVRRKKQNIVAGQVKLALALFMAGTILLLLFAMVTVV